MVPSPAHTREPGSKLWRERRPSRPIVDRDDVRWVDRLTRTDGVGGSVDLLPQSGGGLELNLRDAGGVAEAGLARPAREIPGHAEPLHGLRGQALVPPQEVPSG